VTARLKQTVACQGHSWEAEQAEEQARAAAAAGQLPLPRAPPTDAECEALEQQLSTLARTVAQQRAEVLPMALQREVCLPVSTCMHTQVAVFRVRHTEDSRIGFAGTNSSC
jgi:hypothetical protein